MSRPLPGINPYKELDGGLKRAPALVASEESLTGSVTRWIPGLKHGNQEAQAWVLARYYQRVLRQADERLGRTPRRAHDEEDVASEVFQQFLQQAQSNGFRQLEDRTDLEGILLLLTQRRATDLFRKTVARRKFEVGESALGNAINGPANGPLDAQSCERSIDAEGTLTRELAETIRGLFHSIECQELKLEQIAILRLQGYSADEIADQVGELRRTVYRRLELIRDRWQESLENEVVLSESE